MGTTGTHGEPGLAAQKLSPFMLLCYTPLMLLLLLVRNKIKYPPTQCFFSSSSIQARHADMQGGILPVPDSPDTRMPVAVHLSSTPRRTQQWTCCQKANHYSFFFFPERGFLFEVCGCSSRGGNDFLRHVSVGVGPGPPAAVPAAPLLRSGCW